MAKRSIDNGDSELVTTGEEVQDQIEQLRDIFEIAPVSPGMVKVVLLRNIILNYTGAVTGHLYHFPGAGSVVDVFPEDVPIMLEKTVGKRSCCGSKPGRYFMLA